MWELIIYVSMWNILKNWGTKKKMRNYELYQHPLVYTIKELLDFCAKEYGEKEVFVYQNRKQDISVSCSKFKFDVNAFGTYLFSRIGIGSHIAVFGENSYEWIVTHFAATCGGNVIVPIDKELETNNIEKLLIDSESNSVVYSDTYADIVEQLQSKLPDVIYINMKDMQKYIENGQNLIESGCMDYINSRVCKDDLASIVYTSGTTGASKGVMLTHNNFCSCMYGASCNVEISGTSLLVLPLHHVFGLVAGVYAVMFYGYPIYINRSLKKLVADFQKSRPQNIFAVPLFVEMFHKNIWTTAKKQGKERLLKILIKVSNILLKCKIDLRKVLFQSVTAAFGGKLDLIVIGGAPINEKYIKEFEAFGIRVLNGYGITECGPIVAVNRNEWNIIGSVGVPLCCNDVRIAEDGEVLVKGENVMLGYYHNEEENKKAFIGEWFKTGDIGEIDENGVLYITGRIKNLIILSNGENIPAESIEQEIYGITYVKECIVYGKDNIIIAEVYLDEDVTDGKEKIYNDIQILNQKLPQIRNIGRVIVRDMEFPKTTTKKIKRSERRKIEC